MCLDDARRAAGGLPGPPGAGSAQSRFDVTVTKGLTPLVGREQEVGLLRERWAQAKDGLGQVVVLSGEAGIGKSRLVQVLTEHLAGEAHTRIECHCSPYYQQSALYPVVTSFTAAPAVAPGRSPRRRQLHKLEAAAGAVWLGPGGGGAAVGRAAVAAAA